MENECPHNRSDCYNPCPQECHYTRCERPTYAAATNIDLILDASVDRSAAIKRSCYMCEYFLTHGPRSNPNGPSNSFASNSYSDSERNVSIHLF